MIKSVSVFVISVLILVGIGISAYFFVIRRNEQPIATPQETLAATPASTPGATPGADNKPGSINKLSTESVLAPTLSPDGNNVQYYSRDNGVVFGIDFWGGAKTEIANSGLADLTQVSWSPDNKSVITATRATDGTDQKRYYNYATKENIALDKRVKELAWLDNNTIVYHFLDEAKNRSLIATAKGNGQEFTTLTAAVAPELEFQSIPKTERFAFYAKPTGTVRSSIFTANKNGSDIRRLLPDDYGLDLLFSPDGQKTLYSSTNSSGRNLSLWVLDSVTKDNAELDLITFVDKCTWSADSIILFCAMPKTMPESFSLPDSYYDKRFATDDVFVKYNTVTGVMEELTTEDSHDSAIDASNLFLSPRENILFFLNADQRLYSLTLSST